MERINLLPKNGRVKGKNERFDLILMGGFAFILISLLGAGVFQWINLSTLEKQNLVLKGKKSSLQTKLAKLRIKNAKGMEKESKKSKVYSLLREKMRWSLVFKEISVLIPEDVWLTNVETKQVKSGRKVVITGEASSQNRIAMFLEGLESSYYFSGSKILYSEELSDVKPDLYRFQFECEISQRIKEVNHG